ncbi:LIM-domain binding protein-domain-containing protein [Ephemerocybe angulata]|uniref:LIM-domain binding protein-domain-containing protein n=1 Tax=Ephemerocybe angulata TaxID=980116 RepID=A0A8H6MEV8_9AGAR|nr:LIM-domain binding protein-domain-containing protein [Tulosesus angulatus]
MGMNNGVVSGGMSLPQSQPQSAHMRQLTQMRAAQHQQHQQQLMQQQAQMLRQVGGSTMPPSMSGVGPSQNPVMSSLSQPSIGQQHNAMGLGQNQMQHPFANGVGMSNSQPPHGLSSSSPRPPNGMGMASGPSQAGPRASMTPDNANAMSFINYPGTQFSPGGQRMSGATQQYPFAPASTPPVSDMSDQSRGAFPTPAQQLQMNSSAGSMNSATDPFAGPSFAQPMAPRASQHNNNMQPHPIHTPQLSQRQTPQPTSQSHNTPQPGPSAVLHHSPIHTSNPSDHLPMQPSRPQSRPQSQPQISHNQAASPHGQTPRSGQVPLPPGATIAVPGRGGQQPPPPPTNIPPPPQSQQRPPLQQQHTGGQPPTPGGSQPEQFIGNRPPTMGAPAPPPPTTGPTTLPSGRPAPITSPMLGNGQGLLRMLQFSGILSSENKSKLQLAWWNELVKEYFTPKAVTKITLWKDNAQVEAKPFGMCSPYIPGLKGISQEWTAEIGIPVLPRFFLVTTQSGVKSMTFNLDGARERMCVNAIWTYKYTNGYTITLRGPFTIHMVVTAMHPPTGNGAQPGYMLKIDEWQFSATHHDKMISLDSIAGPRNYEMPADMPRPVPTPPPGSTAATLWAEREAARQWDDPMVVVERATMPSEPINAFGIPQATMRCLELAESVGAMADLISFADETKLGPLGIV